jgi:membrane protein implicated in regulation of membrane protease activity
VLVFILILLLIAALFGVLGAVLKVALILILAAVLTVAVLGIMAWWLVKRSARKITAEYDRQVSQQRVTKYRANEADPAELPPDRDDRY